MNKIINDIGNYYEVKEDVAYITVLKKDGTELITKIDLENLEKIKNMGTWFAEWNKDYNNYIVQNISSTKKNKKSKPLKQSLQSVILNVNPNEDSKLSKIIRIIPNKVLKVLKKWLIPNKGITVIKRHLLKEITKYDFDKCEYWEEIFSEGGVTGIYKKEIFSNKFEVTSAVAILLIMCYNQTRYRYLEGEHSWNYVYLIK